MMKQSPPSPAYIDPSSLSLPSPASDVSSPAHVASSSSVDTPVSVTHSATSAQPSRKRQRTDATPEEKREARAHRNRLAAQNSRDRRKVQFAHLEESVRVLKEENERLRAELQRERERRDNAEKDKENEELKERVKSLEQGWEVVLKALQDRGLPSSLVTPKPPSSPSPDPKPPTTTFPVFIESPPVFPPTPLSVASSSSSIRDQPALNDAADGSIHSPAFSTLDLDAPLSLLQESFGAPSHASPENGVEHWISQVLSNNGSSSAGDALPTSSSGSLPSLSHGQEIQQSQPQAFSSTSPNLIPLDFTSGSMPEENLDLGLRDDIEMGMEMDRLFDLLPESVNTSAVDSEDFRDLLATVLDDSTVVESSDLCDWSSGLPSKAILPASEANSASLVVV